MTAYTRPGIASLPLLEYRNQEEKISTVIQEACDVFSVTREQILGKRQDRNIADARHAVFYVCMVRGGISCKLIGKVFGKDHSTVISGREKVRNIMATNSNFNQLVTKLISNSGF